MKYEVIQQRADRMAAWLAVALGVSIPVSVALDNVLLALFLVCWLAGDVPGKMRLIRRNPVALTCMGLYALLLLGSFYGDATLGQKTTLLMKYKGLLVAALLVPLLQDERIRRIGMNGMTAAIALTIILSALIKLAWFPIITHWFSTNDPSVGAVVFKGQIAQSYMMAVFAFFYAVFARGTTGWRRWLYVLLAAGCISNVLLMIDGRIGYLELAVLAVYYLLTLRGGGWQRVAGMVLIGLIAVGAALVSHRFDQRVEAVVQDARQWSPNKADKTSNGLRLEFYYNTLAIIKQHPLLGLGTGGFANAYRQQVAGTGKFPVDNPHDESLLMTAQLGIFGLIALWFFYYQQWRQSSRLPNPATRHLAQALLISFMLGGLMNSLLINHAESLFIAWMTAWLYAQLGQPQASLQPRTERQADSRVVPDGAPV